MGPSTRDFVSEHLSVTRRHLLQLGVAGVAAVQSMQVWAASADRDASLQKALDELESWLTRPDDFQDVSRGKPKPHSLSEEKRREVGLTRETWTLEVVSDPDHPARITNPLTKQAGNALSFDALMKLGSQFAVRFPKIMTCLNIGCPLGNGIWEGVPLRHVLWMANPTEDLRRVFYYGYHNDDPEQMFRSSLPVGRILEDLYGLPPVILCYKLNGQWLTPERGGPVRVVVPEAYGFKSIKWLTRLVLSNIPHANDTYMEKNNDVDSPLKTFCATLHVPNPITPGHPIPVTGYAQVGISGLSKVQTWIQSDADDWPDDDPHFLNAPWQDAEILPAPDQWGGGLQDNRIPEPTLGFDSKTGRPQTWPLLLSRAHWCCLHDGLPAGRYSLRCRTVDGNGIPQPMPRPFRKSGRASIERIRLKVE